MTNRPNQNLPQPVAAISSKTPYAGAFACLNRRWRIAPLPVGKKKNPPTGYLAAPLVSPAKLKQWEANRPGRNYAVVPGIDLTMLDVDPRHGGDASLFDLELEYGPLPPTFTVRTPSGGTHYYFRGLHRYKLNFRPGLDAPQYVVAPWSMWNGKRYEVIDSREPVPVPNWLPEVIGTPDESPDVEQISEVELDQADNIAWAIHHLRYDAAPSIQGKGGEFALLLAFGALKDHAISKYKAIELIDEWYNKEPRCSPLWLRGDGPIEDRLDVKAENAWRYLVKTQPGSVTAEAEFSDAERVTEADLAPHRAAAAAFDADPKHIKARAAKIKKQKRRALLPATWRPPRRGRS